MIILVGGCSGSGKTTFCREVYHIARERGLTVCHICHDYYYRDLSHLPFDERARNNFDHPDALDTDTLVYQLCQLVHNNVKRLEIPSYDFSTHTKRAEPSILLESADIYLVEGILVLTHEGLRDLATFKVYLDIERDLALVRRIKRDFRDRGRDPDMTIRQYIETVRPMDRKFVMPTKKFADYVVSGENSHQWKGVINKLLG